MVVGTPSSASLDAIAAVPAAVVPCCDTARPTSRVISSDERLLLVLRSSPSISVRGGDSTLPISTAFGGAVSWPGAATDLDAAILEELGELLGREQRGVVGRHRRSELA